MSYQKVNHGFLITGNILDDAGNSYDISGGILDVMILKSYIENMFPLFTIDFKTTEEMRNIMRDQDVSVYLKIAYYNVDDETTVSEEDEREIVEEGIVFEGTIRIYDKPYPTTAAKIEDESDESENQKIAAPFVYYRMSGIPEKLISKNETNVNNIFKDCELIDVAINLLTKVSLTDKIIMQESTNKTIYPSILVPPLSIAPAIQYIDSMYRYIYEHSANLFFDNDAIYLYDPISLDTPLTNTVECNIITTNATENIDDIFKPKVDENGNIKLSYRNVPNYTYSEKISKHSTGSESIFYYYDDNFNLISRTEEDKISFEKVRYLWEKLSVKNYEFLKKGQFMSVALNSINPNLINPLTNFRIISSEYPKPAGDYRVTTASYSFSTSDMKHYKSQLVIGLIKK